MHIEFLPEPKIKSETRAKLRTTSTATITTALYKRGFRNQMIQGVTPVGAGKAEAMVGPAYTLRYIPAREDLNGLEVFRDPAHPQRKGVEEFPEGHVMVIDSRKDASAASAGGILVTRLMVRGVEGVVSDDGFRDSPEIGAMKIHAYHARPSAPTNLTRHQAIDLNVPIGCGDAPVFPGDIIVGDGEGVVVMPAHLADEIADEAVEMTAYEDFVTERVQGGATITGLYPPTDPANLDLFAEWRAKHDR
jgi:regulator of RNase E activity RraA